MNFKPVSHQVEPPNSLLLFACLLAVLALNLLTVHLGMLWDAGVYARALHDWFNGNDPYSLSYSSLLFVYPPVFLWVGGFLARFLSGHSGWWLYLAIYSVCSLALPFVLARFYLRRAWLSVPFAYLLFAMQPRFAGLEALRAGNISNIFYLLALIAALPGIRKNRWELFYVVVFLIAIVKVNILILLLMPLLIGQAQWIPAIFCGACAVVTYPLQRISAPQLFAGYQTAASQQIVNRGDLGFGVMRIAVESENLVHSSAKLSPYIALTVLIGAIACVAIALYRRRQGGNPRSFWIAAASLLAVCPIVAYPMRKRFAPKDFAGSGAATPHDLINQSHSGGGVLSTAVSVDHSLHHAAILVPYVLQVIFALALVCAMLAIRRRLRATGQTNNWVGLVLLATMLCNPRILAYDADIALLAGFVLLASAYALTTWRLLLLAIVVFLPTLFLPFIWAGLYQILMLLFSLIAGYRMVWRQSSTANSRETDALGYPVLA